MQLNFDKVYKKEIIHYASKDTFISSKYRYVYFESGKEKTTVSLPDGMLKKILGNFRIFRRALRLDKCNVFHHQRNLVIVRQGNVYHFDLDTKKLSHTLKLRNCRNFLHQSISASPEGYIYMGEYGSNTERTTVPVYRSVDGGKTWEVIFEFKAGEIKHIHGCYYDKYSGKVWVCTGDFKGENYLVLGNSDFSEVEWIGDGEQKYRACNLFFEQDKVHWLMDSQLEPSYHIVYDRTSKEVETKTKFLGPIWYIKRLSDGYFLATTAQENGDGVLDDKAHMYISTDLENWDLLKSFKHDGLPKKFFKNGIISFADGPASSKEFYMFFEAIKGFDGKAVKCSIS